MVSWFVVSEVCWSLLKVEANFSSGNTSNCHGPRCQSRPRFLQMQGWCKYIVFGVHNYAKCKSLKPQCLRGQQSNLGLNQRCTEKEQAAAELNRPHSLGSPSRHFSQHTCHHASLPLHPYPFLPSSFHILQTRLWLSDVWGCSPAVAGEVKNPPTISIHLYLLTRPGRVTDHLTRVLMTNKSLLPPNYSVQYMNPWEYVQTGAGEKRAKGKVPRQKEMRYGKLEAGGKQSSENRNEQITTERCEKGKFSAVSVV